MKRTSLAVALLVSGCTLAGAGAGAGVTALHNRNVDADTEASYVMPVIAGAVIGLVIDVMILRSFSEGLGSLAKQ